MQDPFIKIISGEIPSFKLHDDEDVMAILDINPANPGHVILFSKGPYDKLEHIPSNVYSKISFVTKKLSQQLISSLKVQGTTILVQEGVLAGQRVPRVIFHIIPRRQGDNILQNKTKLIEKEDLIKLKSLLQPELDSLFGKKQQTLPELENSGEKVSEENVSQEKNEGSKNPDTQPELDELGLKKEVEKNE